METNTAPVLQDEVRLSALYRLNLLDSMPEESFDRATRLATRLLGTPVALLSLLDADRQFFKSSIGLAEPWASRRETPLSHSFCQYPVASQQPLIISDAREHPLLKDNLAIPDLGVIAYAGIPLVMHSDLALGTFCVIDTQPRVWTDEELTLLRDLAGMVRTELELREALLANAELLETTRQLAIHDGLTGLHNRRGLFELGAREVERARRTETPLTALLLDVDHFKAVNDTYGHAIGDEVLQGIATRCQGEIRAIDLIARYGGEEFAVLLAGSTGAEGILVAERLREAVAGTPLETSVGPLTITLSIGVAELDATPMDLLALLDRADQTLYAAKQAGRNRVLSAWGAGEYA